MFKKINRIENLSIFLLVINVVLIIFYIVGLPLVIFVLLIASINTVLVYYLYKNTSYLKETINRGRNILPNSVIKAIELDKYSIVMYDKETYKINWFNEYFQERFGAMIDKDIRKIFDGYFFSENRLNEYLFFGGNYYNVIEEEESFVLKDVSEFVDIKKRYENEKDCILFIKIDNLEDRSSSLDEVTYQNIIFKIRALINEFSLSFDGILRRYKNDSYIMVVKQKDLDILIDKSQDLLEAIRDISSSDSEQASLSIGLAFNFDNLKETESEAGKALNMALARGGDQIVIKEKNKDFIFYGGASEAVEKRNRVRVRLMANSLESLILQASNVIVMPHVNADLDAIGACLGVVEFTRINKKEAYICADFKNIEKTSQEAILDLNLADKFKIRSEESILSKIDDNSLLVVVDTSNFEIVESQKVYQKIEKRVIIDHHRRSKDFIENPILVYIEPYASSTVELVSELLRFQTKSYKLLPEVATLMLAGMMVDTSYFTIRTGVRTFEAATFLKEQGASPLHAKEILLISRDTYEKKLKIVKNAEYINDVVAISMYKDEPVTKTLLAQSAVELLDLKDIIASFVMANLEDGSIGVSARSNGEFNVQMIMEKIGGGGHFSMAGAQINADIVDLKDQLIEYIKEGIE